MDMSWDATDLQSTHRHSLTRENYLPTLYLILQSETLAVDVEAKEYPMGVFIDEMFTLAVDESIWVELAQNLTLMVIHTVFRPLQTSSMLTLDDPLSLRKLAAVVRLVEFNTCLFRYIHTCSLRVFLPK